MTMPPPTPKRPLKMPAAVPIVASLTIRRADTERHTTSVPSAATLADVLAPMREDPSRSAVLLDVDGTLAPIVRHADDAHVPEPTRVQLIAVAKRYGLVGCISGRQSSIARR